MSKEQIAIRQAFDALCDYQSPSLTNEQKNKALGRCWKILSSAVLKENSCSTGDCLNNWSYGEEKEIE